MSKIVIDKEVLQSLVASIPQSVVQLHRKYMEHVEPFAAVDQIETVLSELVADQRILTMDWDNAGMPVPVYYVE